MADGAAGFGARPVSAWSGAAFRILFGLLGVAAAMRFVAKGWVYELYTLPEYHFTYPGFWWVRPWPEWGMYIHFGLMALAAVGVALGYRYRLSIAAFFVLFTYVELIDKATYLNHYYWVSLASFLMIFMPLNRVASLDALRNSGRWSETIPVWTIWTLRAQLAVVYVFSGIAKLNADWLVNAQPLRIWLYNSGDTPLVGEILRDAWPAYAMSWAGAAFDLTIVGWLLWARSRPYAYACVVVFHAATWFLFPIGMFPWIMICGTLIFFSPDWPRRLWAKLRRGRLPPEAAAPSADFRADWRWRLGLAALALFALIQVALPLRHLAYPGNARWNEDGYRFAWRVMLTEKIGDARFRVKDTDSGREWLVYPEEYLTALQIERMSYRPDMIRATARIIAEDMAARGRPNVEVRADVFVTMNGRKAARFIDPEVDLARIEPRIGASGWVLGEPP